MKKHLLAFVSILFFSAVAAYGQADDQSQEKKTNDQEALDESMLNPEQKKMMKEQEKHYKKIKQDREKKDKITRKRAAKVSQARLRKSGKKTSKKKKRYVKTHS